MTRLQVTRTFIGLPEFLRDTNSESRDSTAWRWPDQRYGPYCGRLLQRLLQQPAQLADETAAEGQHAHHEDDALHDGDPGAELREVVLHRQHHERAHHG